MRRLLRRRLKNPSRVDDAFQKTFLKVHAARHRYRVGSPVRPWVLTIARNVAFDQLRRKSSSEQSLSEEVALRLPDPSDAVQEREALRDLQRALDSLPRDKRDVVELHKIEGLSMAQVAERVGINEGTARVRAHRGYKALRELLAAA
ncbi:MAG: RNA polymerase sigma factor [Deltaproteobacteria bacterium]|nr:RNA polymerase sigma factor [Deltaproteobacteria bacterium]